MRSDEHRTSAERRRPAGSIFRPGTPACHATLSDLSVVLKQLGFVVEKKRDDESTLRVYVRERHRYPLLNPRFQRRSIPGLASRAILEITALSKGDDEIDRRLSTFPSSTQVWFQPVRSRNGAYFNHGYSAVPLVFRGEGRRRVLDVAALGPALAAILRHLE